ncbi:MAG: DUF86 domain-containing protein [Parcubacteria group bacterium CG_4_9_14_0_2_um_filter_41_8]|nr:MAG: hypothetical protein COV79_03930 [Parcubacteria group bacterium CG11_big_fil_rev_8_21_14_0_20_41_14]PJC40771.1 MAG: DUF86 domain-containing protein [Parcubacteria group bacterium CG_4_9_14_0_2_um_filter_41_8]
MREGREIKLYLRDICDSIDMIQSFIKGVSREEFIKLHEKQNAVIRKIEIIGEAVKQLPIEFRDQYPHIPWKEIAGMRDKLIHGYFGVDLDVVWDAVKKNLPKLKKEVEKLFDEIKP